MFSISSLVLYKTLHAFVCITETMLFQTISKNPVFIPTTNDKRMLLSTLLCGVLKALTKIKLIHCSLVTSYGVIDLGKGLVRVIACFIQCQAIAWTNVVLLSLEPLSSNSNMAVITVYTLRYAVLFLFALFKWYYQGFLFGCLKKSRWIIQLVTSFIAVSWKIMHRFAQYTEIWKK